MSDTLPVCTADPWIDIGHGVSVQKRYLDGVLHGIAYRHTCNGRPDSPDFLSVKPEWADGWNVVSLDPLTLSPSVLCRTCQLHGFIRDGRWVPA
jgi:hypothetical protein